MAMSWASFLKSSLRATKSVSQFTSTMTPIRPPPWMYESTTPCDATRPAFFSAMAAPRLRSHVAGLLDAPAALFERPLAVHDRRAGLLAKLLDLACIDSHHSTSVRAGPAHVAPLGRVSVPASLRLPPPSAVADALLGRGRGRRLGGVRFVGLRGRLPVAARPAAAASAGSREPLQRSSSAAGAASAAALPSGAGAARPSGRSPWPALGAAGASAAGAAASAAGAAAVGGSRARLRRHLGRLARCEVVRREHQPANRPRFELVDVGLGRQLLRRHGRRPPPRAARSPSRTASAILPVSRRIARIASSLAGIG